MKQKIVRKDGIVFERRTKAKILNDSINIRIEKNKKEKIKEIANKLGVGYQELIKNKLDELINEGELISNYIEETANGQQD